MSVTDVFTGQKCNPSNLVNVVSVEYEAQGITINVNCINMYIAFAALVLLI